MNIDLVNNIIKSNCILNNFVRGIYGYYFEDTLNNPLIETIALNSVQRNNRTALKYCVLFSEYIL